MLTTMLMMTMTVSQIKIAEVKAGYPEDREFFVARAFAEDVNGFWTQNGNTNGFVKYGDAILHELQMGNINTPNVLVLAGSAGPDYYGVEGEAINFFPEHGAFHWVAWLDEQLTWQLSGEQTGPIEWTHNLLTIGDSSLDGEFNSSDLVQVFQRGEYEDAVEDNSTWESGDWSLDREFDSGDLVLAFQQGEYEQPHGAIAIPEPSTFALLLVAALGLIRSSGNRRL